MSVFNNKGIINSGLIFSYDMNNSSKSWKGEPTTNILPTPSANGRFTTSNGWGTYNTNQYNGNTYFSIGTVSSVSNNVVTMTSAHPLRTYDVVRPQTTGGGLTAGVNYLIRKISSTQFTIHAYNSSQNGSQGYIDPATGMHKVHESIALDQRIAINATSFPTMWWGAPHLPNSGIVKEIVPNAGPKGQPAMRIHIPRTDGVADGMAYGVYTPVTVGDIINVSYWQRTNYPGKNLNYTTYFGGNSAFSGNYAPSDTDWHRVSFQWTASVTYNFYQYWFPSGSTDTPYWVDIADLQVEVNTQGGDSPFVAGTRSTTEALIDLTRQNTITLSSLTYNTDGSFSFDNVNDFIDTNFPAQTINNCTICAWVYDNTADTNYRAIVQNNIASDDALYVNPSNYLMWWPATASTLTVPKNAWTFVAASHTYGSGILYQVNDTQQFISGTFADPTDWDFLRIGGHSTGDGERWGGYIPVVNVYNRALTSTELQQNFNALRGRYGI